MNNIKKYKAVIFDLDGTLLDTLDDLYNAVNHTMDVFGYPHRTRDEVRRFVGNGVDKLIELSLPGGADDVCLAEAIKEYRSFYKDNSENLTKPYRGINEVINKLVDEGYSVAVVSNKIHTSTVYLCKKYFPRIEFAFGERESEGVRRKPHPDMLVSAAEVIGAGIEECVYIGDSEVDILTANNAGIDCISVLWGFRDKDYLVENGGTVFAETPDEMYNIIVNNYK